MNQLVERTEQLRQIIHRLRRGEWCAIVSPPLSGKTTLASQLGAEIAKVHPAWRVTRVAFEPAGTLEDAWLQVLEQMLVATPGLVPRRSRQIADGLAKILEDRDVIHCLILDNLDALPDEVLRLFAAELRKFYNGADYADKRQRFHCVLVGATGLLHLTSGPNSPLSNVVEVIPLPNLSVKEASQSLSGRLDGISVSEEARTALFNETAGHPYLTGAIADQLRGAVGEVTLEAVDYAARLWCEMGNPEADSDPCFSQAVRYIETHGRAFEVILDLLEGRKPCRVATVGDEDVLMCGAVVQQEGCFGFCGRMFERAFHHYMDDLRKADYWCLHGDWTNAQGFYHRVAAPNIQERRQEGVGHAARRIMDLYLGITPPAIRYRQLVEAERLVTETGRHFFGADHARLWRLEADESAPRVVHEIGDRLAASVELPSEDMASAAARKEIALTLTNNAGIVQGIGDDPTRLRWSLELYYEHGLPAGDWVRYGLQYVNASLYMILDRARQRELEDRRQREQRKLIHDIALELQRATKVEDIFSLIVDGVRDRLQYECAQLSLVFPEENLIRDVHTNGVFDKISGMTVRKLDGEDVLALVVRERKRRIIGDCEAPDSHCDPTTVGISRMKSFVAVPLLDGDEVVGVLQVGDTSRHNAFDGADAELFLLLADGAATAIRMAREREALELVCEAAGNATAVVDSQGFISSCNDVYRDFFGVGPNEMSPLTSGGDSRREQLLVNVAFHRKRPVQTVRERTGRKYIATAVGLPDPFGRYAGGVEIVETKSPLYGLTDAITEMLKMSSREQLGKAIVKCLCDYLGYTRARLYEIERQGRQLVSRWSEGLDQSRAKRFTDGDFVLERSSNGQTAKGFECIRLDAPVIIVRQKFAKEDLPLRVITHDSQGRRVMMISEEDVLHIQGLDKESLAEWIDVPLGVSGSPLGKLSVDLKGSSRQLGLEDVEMLALFARWATEAMTRLVNLEKEKREARLVRDVRLLGERRGLETLGWDFLLNITLQGGPGFNRAALFLKHAKSKHIHGFLCHGASSSDAWGDSMKTLIVPGDRRDFMAEARREKMTRHLSEEDEKRIKRFREMVIVENDPSSPFSRAMRQRSSALVTMPTPDLTSFLSILGWEKPPMALICPLVYEGECEGLVYVDRAFMKRDISRDDQELLETLCFHLAAIARPLRLSEELQFQLLELSHTTVTPVAAIRALADCLKDPGAQDRRNEYLDLIIAESERAADILRKVSRVSAIDAQTIRSGSVACDVCDLLARRVAPYFALLEADGIKTRLDACSTPITVYGDPGLLGDAFAELTANGYVALASSAVPRSRRCFKVSCVEDQGRNECVVTLENSGPEVPEKLRDRIFDRHVSTTGSTGVGLWLVRKIVELHNGRIEYRVTEHGLSQFRLVLPLATT